MQTTAIVFTQPFGFALRSVELAPVQDEDVVVDVAWTGISSGTERLLWSGRMPAFPGMGYPLVPGYESVGRVAAAGRAASKRIGDLVFVPGASCFRDVRPLFGGAAARLVIPSDRAIAISEDLSDRGVLLALAATALHAVRAAGETLPDLIVGHGALGRLMARIVVACGGLPVVWEIEPARRDGAVGYTVIDPGADGRRNYATIADASGAEGLLDSLIARLAPGGQIVLAGFYSNPLSFSFPPAFMREARITVAAQWQPADLIDVAAWVASGRLSLDGIITDHRPAESAAAAYERAFSDPRCLKMALDWAGISREPIPGARSHSLPDTLKE